MTDELKLIYLDREKTHPKLAKFVGAPWRDRWGRWVNSYPNIFRKIGGFENRFLFEENGDLDKLDPIFITGLARSGSTILLEALFAHSDTASHQYQDYPFVHTPLLWNQFLTSAKRKVDFLEERIHQDRILVNAESPEAMEEMIWMSFFKDLHDESRSHLLDESFQAKDFKSFYIQHLKKIVAIKNAKRYLSKSNCNLTRIAYLHKIIPSAKFLIPIREPMAHVASLIKQHRLLSDILPTNSAAQNQMDRMGHFEFGPHRKAVNAGNKNDSLKIAKAWCDGEDLKAYLLQWLTMYSHLEGLLNEGSSLVDNVMVVDYDELCDSSRKVLNSLFKFLDLSGSQDIVQRFEAELSKPDYYLAQYDELDIGLETRDIQQRCSKLYVKLKHYALTQYEG